MSDNRTDSRLKAEIERPHASGERRRFLALLLAVFLVALAVAASVFSRDPQQRFSLPVASNQVVASDTAGASSQAWYCPGPLPIGGWPHSVSSIYLADIGTDNLTATIMVSSSLTHYHSRINVSLYQHSGVVVPLTRSGIKSFAAVSVIANGPGIAATQVLDGPNGETASNCLTSPAESLGLAAGSTLDGKNINLSIYDPTSTASIVNVALSVVNIHDQSESLAPPKLQGITLEPGQVETFDIGKSIPEEVSAGLLLTALGGKVVAGAQLINPGFANLGEGSLVTAAVPSANRWSFPPIPAGLRDLNTYSILNPNDRKLKLHFRLGENTKTAAENIVLSPDSETVLTPPLSSAPISFSQIKTVNVKGFAAARQEAEKFLLGRQLPQMVPTEITERSYLPLVIERSLVSVKAQQGPPVTLNAAAIGIIHNYYKASAIQIALELGLKSASQADLNAVSTLPGFGQGTATVNAFSAPMRKWLILAGRSNKVNGQLFTVSNPGNSSAKVRFFRIPMSYINKQSGPPTTGKYLPVITIELKGHSTATIDPDYLIGEPGPVAMEVVSRKKIFLEDIGYGRKAAGGISLSTPLPIRP